MPQKPIILISNDDGVHAPALDLMAQALQELGEVYVVAPDRDKSGSSQSLTLLHPLHLNWLSERKVSVQGTPADCVHLASTGLLPRTPALVISGINIGSNLGDDVLYSGTVAAAFEASTCGIPALAFSLVSHEPQHYNTALYYMRLFAEKALLKPLSADVVLNINIPDLEKIEISGVMTTRLGKRKPSFPMIRYTSPRKRDCYWIGKPGESLDNGAGTDFAAISAKNVSVTPLHIDMTDYKMIDVLSTWIE